MNRNNATLTFKESWIWSGDTASHFVWTWLVSGSCFLYRCIWNFAIAPNNYADCTILDMAIDPVIGILLTVPTPGGENSGRIYYLAQVPYAVLAILTFTTPDFGKQER